MSEDPGEYKVENSRKFSTRDFQRISGKRLQRVQIVSDMYFQQVATFAEAAVIAGATEVEDIAEFAVQLTDKLIEMTGGK